MRPLIRFLSEHPGHWYVGVFALGLLLWTGGIEIARLGSPAVAQTSCPSIISTLVRVIDGDTFDIHGTVKLSTVWLQTTVTTTIDVTERIRLLGVNTPERGQPGYTEAAVYTEAWIRASSKLAITACRRDAFGRVLGTVARDDGRDLTMDLIWNRLGVKFP